MSTASVNTRPFTPASAFGRWFQKSLTGFRSASVPSVRPPFGNRQEADKLRALARDMMRIDAGSAADMYAAADRHEFGYSA